MQEKNNKQRVQRFSIRKLTIGVTSVLLSTLFLAGNKALATNADSQASNQTSESASSESSAAKESTTSSASSESSAAK
ncbi:YSIRK-type signal peptide-containing protein, partial [Lactobacillus mulieris]